MDMNTEEIIEANSNKALETDRKKDHIQLAFQSQTGGETNNRKLNYEPVLSAHPGSEIEPVKFLGKTMLAPLWISSMTGGTEMAHRINHNLARACAEFGLGMGLGSCRKLLDDNTYFEDFNLRPIIGSEYPLYANLGIAQIEESLSLGEADKISELVYKLDADGLIVHINPLQEWLQPEGDVINRPPIDTISELLDLVDFKLIVKEVGQGMGPKSLKALFKLPLAAVDFAAYGGTNFAMIELLRGSEEDNQMFMEIAGVGHTAEEMVTITNQVLTELGDEALCKDVIISGGVKSFLDGYYLINKLNANAVYGQGSAFLKHAMGTYDELRTYVHAQIKGLQLANALLEIK